MKVREHGMEAHAKVKREWCWKRSSLDTVCGAGANEVVPHE